MSLKVIDSVASFKSSVSEGMPVIVDFFADWCGPCRMLSPVLEELSKDLSEKVNIVKVNIDNVPDLANSMNIRSIPTMILFVDGQPVDTKMGFLNSSQIKEWLKASSVAI